MNKRDKSVTRKKILDAAEDVFAEKGYHDSLMDDIAERSSTSKGALYFHFPSKESLFFSLLDKLADSLVKDVEKQIETKQTAIDKIEIALESVLKALTKRRKLAQILLRQGYGLGPKFEEKRLELFDRFADLIQQNLQQAVDEGSIPSLNVEITAYAWLGALNEVVTRWLFTKKPHPLKEALPVLIPLFLRGIGANQGE
jgi:AcrR family transcriptional regulator